jgi:hypothetical protein
VLRSANTSCMCAACWRASCCRSSSVLANCRCLAILCAGDSTHILSLQALHKVSHNACLPTTGNLSKIHNHQFYMWESTHPGNARTSGKCEGCTAE